MDYSEELIYKKKKRRAKFILGSVVFLAIVFWSGATYLYFFTDAFYFSNLEITGLKSLKQDEVLAKNKISFFENLSFSNPLIKTSEVYRNYISKSLLIAIHEREPYAIWCRSTELVQEENSTSTLGTVRGNIAVALSGCYWFDKDGFVFAKAPETEGVLLREVEDVSLREVKIGEYVLPDVDRAGLFKIFGFVDALGIEVRQFRLESLDKQEVTAFTKAGPKIYLSLRLDPSFAMEPFRATLTSILPTLQYIDLRSENKIFYR